MIGLLTDGVGEALRAAQEAALDRDDRSVATLFGEEIELLEVLAHDGLDALDVEQLEGEGPPTGRLEAPRAVAVGEAQELLALAELGPRELTGEEILHEATDLGAEVFGLPDQTLGVTECVRGEILGVSSWSVDRVAVDREASSRLSESIRRFREADQGGPDWQPSPAQVEQAIQAQRDFVASDPDVGPRDPVSLASVRPDYPGGPDVVRPPYTETLVGKTGDDGLAPRRP
jgi:hypothetical protein